MKKRKKNSQWMKKAISKPLFLDKAFGYLGSTAEKRTFYVQNCFLKRGVEIIIFTKGMYLLNL